MVFGKKKRAHRRRRRGLLAAIFLLAVLVFFFYDSTTRLVTEEFTVSTSAIPQSFDGFRIVQLSDLHGSTFGTDNRWRVQHMDALARDTVFPAMNRLDKALKAYAHYGSAEELLAIAEEYGFSSLLR